jgi:hypothetical protein
MVEMVQGDVMEKQHLNCFLKNGDIKDKQMRKIIPS